MPASVDAVLAALGDRTRGTTGRAESADWTWERPS